MAASPEEHSLQSQGKFSVVVPIRIGLIILDRKRAGFDVEWGLEMKSEIRKTFDALSEKRFRKFVPEVVVVDDNTIRQALRSCEQASVDVLILTQPTISDGRLAPIIAQQWKGGLVVWGTPEKQTGSMVSANSLVGSHLFASIFSMMNRPFQFVFTNTDWALASEKLTTSIQNIQCVNTLGSVKLALIGHQAPGFLDFHPHPFLLNKTFGCIMQHVGLNDFFAMMNGIPNEEVQSDVEVMQSKGWLTKENVEYSADDLEKASRTYLAMKKLAQEENFDGIAIRCWPELPRDYGCWPLLGLARLATEGLPIACEGDIDGCLGCVVAKFLGAGAIYLTDILEYDADTLTMWHGGMAPEQLSEDSGTPIGPCIARHFNNNKPGILDAVIKIDIPVTLFRFWVRNNEYHLAVVEGVTVDPVRKDGSYLMGNSGLIQFDEQQLGGRSMVDIFEDFVTYGMPHHACVVAGHIASRLRKFCQQSGVKLLSPDPRLRSIFS